MSFLGFWVEIATVVLVLVLIGCVCSSKIRWQSRPKRVQSVPLSPFMFIDSAFLSPLKLRNKMEKKLTKPPSIQVQSEAPVLFLFRVLVSISAYTHLLSVCLPISSCISCLLSLYLPPYLLPTYLPACFLPACLARFLDNLVVAEFSRHG